MFERLHCIHLGDGRVEGERNNNQPSGWSFWLRHLSFHGEKGASVFHLDMTHTFKLITVQPLLLILRYNRGKGG